ncbi:MAG: CFI-box-CTERM domain-containing protein [Smithellaceae bacterium]
MHAIKENPYRTLGLFGNTTEKELQKQIAVIKRYAEIGKSKSFDFDFPFLGDFKREEQSVKEAASRVEQAKNKVLYALFWFVKNDRIDEIALNHLKDGNLEKAIEIWGKTLKDSIITTKNFSAASNLSTLKLAITTNNGSFDADKFYSSMDMKGKLLTSDAFNNLVATVVGNEIMISREAIIKDFADEITNIIYPYLLKPVEKSGLVEGKSDKGIGLYRWDNGDYYLGEFEKGNRTGFGIYVWGSGNYFQGYFKDNCLHGEGVCVFTDGSQMIGAWTNDKFQDHQYYDKNKISKEIRDKVKSLVQDSGISFNAFSIAQFIHTFRNFPSETKQYIIHKFTDRPIVVIESKLEDCSNKRQKNPSEAAVYGEVLFKQTKSDLILLKNILGENQIRYQMIVNKVAEEILQCAIDYINYYEDRDAFDPSEKALHVLKLAKSLKPTGPVKARVEDNEIVIQEIVDEKPARDRNRKIKAHVNFINDKLKIFQDLSASITNVKDLVSSCKPRLELIKEVLGIADEFYLKISGAVVGNARGMLVDVVNNAQEFVNRGIDRSTSLRQLYTAVRDALEITELINSFDMNSELRNKVNADKNTLQKIDRQINTQMMVSSMSRSMATKKEGCYIATLVYGSYDHQQVLQLRKFRDEKLAASYTGRIFIALYYKISPQLVKALKNKPTIHSMIRSLLNTFIGAIK